MRVSWMRFCENDTSGTDIQMFIFRPAQKMLMFRVLALFLLMTPSIWLVVGSVPWQVQISYSKPGDFILGGLFGMTLSSSGFRCDITLSAQTRVELMPFAIEQINNRTDLLPNVTLGFDIRDYCASESLVAAVALSMAGVLQTKTDDSGLQGQFIGIVGPGASTTSIATAIVTRAFDIPVISYTGSSIELSNKRRFPYLLRTWPPATLQTRAIVDILTTFNWSYVGLIYSLNSYGIHGAQEIKRLGEAAGICLAYSLPIRESASDSEIQEIVDKILNFQSARVIVFFTHLFYEADYGILRALSQRERSLPELTLVCGDSFGVPSYLTKHDVVNLTIGSFVVAGFFKDVPDFRDYLRNAEESGHHLSTWYRNATAECTKKGNCKELTGSQDYHVVDAVYAFATALDEMLRTDCAANTECLRNGTVTGPALMARLREVTFNGVDGVVRFDENGDPLGKYAVKNIQFLAGELVHVNVGEWDSRRKSGDHLHLRTGDLLWATGTKTPPRSVCKEECLPGYKVVPLEEKCCYGCRKCPVNAVVVNDTRCQKCDKFHWPAKNFSICKMIVPSSTDWRNAVTIIILVLSSIGLGLSTLAASGIIYYRKHALIKATSRELSVVNIIGLFVTFMSVFLIMAYPTRVSCFLSEAMIALSLNLTYAPTTLKVNRIFRIFKASRHSNQGPRFIGARDQLVIVSVLTLFQLAISVISLIWAPSVPKLHQQSRRENYTEIFCEFGSGFLASCVYILLLILVCCYYAFRTRKVPSNYNESKFIAISVYSTLVLCLAAVPVYTTAVAVLQKVATLGVALLLNAYLTLVCVYLPKLYAARFVKNIKVSDWRTATTETGGTSGSTLTASGSQSVSTQRSAKIHPLPVSHK